MFSRTRSLQNAPLYRCSVRTMKQRRTVNKLVEVQLLKTLPGIGVEGQILHVKPGYMRNYLHIDNKACYVTPNNPPRIPVVDVEELRLQEQRKRRQLQKEQEEKVVEVVADKKEIEESANEVSEGAMSLEELSDLFSSMRSSKRTSDKPELNIQSNIFDTSKGTIPGLEVEFDSIQDLDNKLPKLLTLSNSALPITKKAVAKHMEELTERNVDIGKLDLSYIDTPEDHLDSITETGRFQVQVRSADDSSVVTRVLEVE
ncbi:hypothetical protein KGF57_001816 [Candida theae]|uniref:Ribosomal protein L9 domain-containing protein n=1 Tax=Candida theae TaxID=1198502 RepID=A0AAD5BGA8_9ASCO|nr:uncharacterized protein KGF57_001816 [Candida theae]KAI5960884.1 hypothetical protein KGF57_001816 [Candida theae]